MDSEILLIEKDGFKFSRETKNHYKMEFSMENKKFKLCFCKTPEDCYLELVEIL